MTPPPPAALADRKKVLIRTVPGDAGAFIQAHALAWKQLVRKARHQQRAAAAGIRPETTVTCRHCGTGFTDPGTGPPRRYCSPRCRTRTATVARRRDHGCRPAAGRGLCESLVRADIIDGLGLKSHSARQGRRRFARCARSAARMRAGVPG